MFTDNLFWAVNVKASGPFSVLGRKRKKKSRRKRGINGQSFEYDIQLQTEGRVLLQVRGCRGDVWSPRSIWIGAWRLCFKRNTKCLNVLFRLKIRSFNAAGSSSQTLEKRRSTQRNGSSERKVTLPVLCTNRVSLCAMKSVRYLKVRTWMKTAAAAEEIFF